MVGLVVAAADAALVIVGIPTQRPVEAGIYIKGKGSHSRR